MASHDRRASPNGNRVRGAVLAMVTAAVLAAGGWWWLEAAPDAVPAVRAVVTVSVPPVLGGPFSVVTGQAADGAERALPQARRAIRPAPAVLDEMTSISWSFPSGPGRGYRVQYACVGLGHLHIRAQGAVDGWSDSLGTCAGSLHTADIVAEGDRLAIVARRLNHETIEVAVQLVPLRR